MIDPRLSDFSEDQQKLMLQLVLKEQSELRFHIQSIHKYEGVADLLQDSLLELNERMEELEELATQFAGAVVRSQNARIAISN